MRRRDERGLVTAEMAVVAPLGVALAFLMLWVVSLGVTQVRLADASREAARMVARGESVHDARSVASRQAPRGTVVEIRRDDGLVTVSARVSSRLPLPFFDGVGSRRLVARSVAVSESS